MMIFKLRFIHFNLTFFMYPYGGVEKMIFLSIHIFDFSLYSLYTKPKIYTQKNSSFNSYNIKKSSFYHCNSACISSINAIYSFSHCSLNCYGIDGKTIKFLYICHKMQSPKLLLGHGDTDEGKKIHYVLYCGK